MKVLKDTFHQSFKLHNYWELKKKNAYIFACTHKRTCAYMHIEAYTQAHTGAHTIPYVDIIPCAHIGTILYTQAYPYTHRLTKIYFN